MTSSGVKMIFVAIIAAGIFALGWYCARATSEPVFVVKKEPVYQMNPAPKFTSAERHEISVPVVLFAPADTVRETVVVKIGPDSARLSLYVEHKLYNDPTYTLQVSGPKIGDYGPNLDWIRTYKLPDEIQVPQIKSKPRRWGIGIQAGYGAVLAPQVRMYPYVGIGISYNILTF